MCHETSDEDFAHYRELARLVPSWAWESVVSIAVQQGSRLAQHGTGTLFAMGQERFVVTAGHVVRQASKHEARLYCSVPNGTYFPLVRTWTCSTSGAGRLAHDPFDIAVYHLNEEDYQRLGTAHYVRTTDLTFNFDDEFAVYSLFGFPSVWSQPESTNLTLKRLEFTGYGYDGNLATLELFRSDYHLAIRARLDETKDEFAQDVRFTTLAGIPVDFPVDLGGISGCPVWRIGDRRMPVSNWSSIIPKLVAVETGAYPKGVIKATRWVAVTTLLRAAFPQLRPAFDLSIPISG